MERFTRQEFLTERWAYRPGEHVSLITPTQNGKTTLIFQLLAHTDMSFCTIPPVMLVAKPKDLVVAQGLEQLEYEEIPTWPPRRKLFQDRPPGYGLWPRHLRNVPPEVDEAYIVSILQPAIQDLFWHGQTVTVADEMYELCAVLGLQKLMTRHWTQGGGMGSGLWSATQKPSGTQQGTIPSFMYSAPTHTFLGGDNDERNRKRFSEIGGVSPKLVERTVMGLSDYEWLYIHRRGPKMCIVEAGG